MSYFPPSALARIPEKSHLKSPNNSCFALALTVFRRMDHLLVGAFSL
jgi:hypothetical protein